MIQTPKDGMPYRPHSGTEGAGFQEVFCCQCKRDAAFQANPDAADGCPIVAATYRYDAGDALYPKEWVWKDGLPVCTAFEHVDDPDQRITPEEAKANLQLFPTT